METRHGNLYDYPAYYDLVFGSDWKSEFDFLRACFELHARGVVRRLFEPACGTGRLLYRLGAAGFEASGLDLNPRAVAYCNRRLARHALAESAFVGDMTDFRLRRKVDAAFNTINSFRHLQTEQAARAHLECMAAAVRQGGVYLLGLHLTPRGYRGDQESWSARRGHLQVNTHMQTTEYDPRRRLEAFSMSYDVYTPTRAFRLIDEVRFRTYTPTQFNRLLAAVGKFDVAATYDFAYDTQEPIVVDAATEDVVFVLVRK
ncbi:MAG: class I SAM-dependent methyltransferase [Pirellulaceae bacterium]